MAKRFIRDKFLIFFVNFTLHMILSVRSRHTGEWPNILFNLINSTWLFPIFSCLVHLTLFWITRRNWKLITFQNKQKQECLSWRENFSLKWKFDLFLFFFVLFFCFVCCVLVFFFLHSGQTSPYQNYSDHWASETISYAYSSKPDEKSAWSKKQKKRKPN